MRLIFFIINLFLIRKELNKSDPGKLMNAKKRDKKSFETCSYNPYEKGAEWL